MPIKTVTTLLLISNLFILKSYSTTAEKFEKSDSVTIIISSMVVMQRLVNAGSIDSIKTLFFADSVQYEEEVCPQGMVSNATYTKNSGHNR